MTINDIERALTIFRGIANRDKELATRFMHPTRYKQHNPHASDGVAGVEEWIEQLPAEKHPLATARAFQDGPYVFAHTVGNVTRPAVFLDIFKFEDGLVVEHWVVWTDLAQPNNSGHTQTDGPAVANDREKTESNKSLVRHFYQSVLIPGRYEKMSDFLLGDRFIRHDPHAEDGVEAFQRALEKAAKRDKPLKVEEVKFVLGEGDFVLAASQGSLAGEVYAFFDLYRIENDKLAEHWTVPMKVPPRSEWKNQNGIL
jgi:predicted SnoaL-like aldol condensation-catalyzing enzyme